MEILFKNMAFNLFSILIIILFIFIMYKNLFGKIASAFLENQKNIIYAGSIVNTIILNIYYLLIIPSQISSQYQSLILIALFMIEGIAIDTLYQRYLRSKNSKYNPSSSEYLVLMIISFLAVSILMVSDGIMHWTDIFIIVLGRLIWFDVPSFKALKESINVQHKRILETAILLIIGVMLISISTYMTHDEPWIKLMIALVYGILIIFVYGRIRKKQMKKRSIII